MGALEGIVEKLKRVLGQGAAETPAPADAGPHDEQELSTNAKPAGAGDEPWPRP
jgi:hypothetical protein